MSLFESNRVLPKSDDYTFVSGADTDELLRELEQPKRHFDAPEPEPEQPENQSELSDERADGGAPDGSAPEKPSPADARRASRTAAKFVVGAVDGGLSFLASSIAESEDASPYKADKEEREQLTDLWAEYLKGKGGDLPPGVMLLLMMAIVYGPKMKLAFDDRRKNRLIRKQQQELDERERENRELRIELERRKMEAEKMKMEHENAADRTSRSNAGGGDRD